MIVKLDTQRLQTLDQVREFLAGSRPLDLQPQTRAEAYAFVAEAPATVRLLPPGEGRQGPDPPLPEQGDRPLTRAGHPPAAPAPDHRSHRRPPPPPAPLPTPLHQGRHRAARRSRCPPRHPLRSGHPQALRPGLAAVRRPQLRAPRRHLQRTPLGRRDRLRHQVVSGRRDRLDSRGPGAQRHRRHLQPHGADGEHDVPLRGGRLERRRLRRVVGRGQRDDAGRRGAEDTTAGRADERLRHRIGRIADRRLVDGAGR